MVGVLVSETKAKSNRLNPLSWVLLNLVRGNHLVSINKRVLLLDSSLLLIVFYRIKVHSQGKLETDLKYFALCLHTQKKPKILNSFNEGIFSKVNEYSLLIQMAGPELSNLTFS